MVLQLRPWGSPRVKKTLTKGDIVTLFSDNRQFCTTPPNILSGGILVGWPFKNQDPKMSGIDSNYQSHPFL